MKTYAVVTGASAGLGREFAKLLAADGFGLVLVARRRDELETLARELTASHGVEVVVLPSDLTDPTTPTTIVSEIERRGLEVEILVNNAGFGSNGNYWELDTQKELGMIQVNITALAHLTRLLLPGMVAKGRGRILNIGSTAGFQPGPFMATYYASKAFVNSFTEALAFELRGTGVTATLSCPGATATEFARVAGNDKSRLFKMGGTADAATVAKEAYLAMLAGKGTVVHGLKNKAGVQALRVSPRAAIVAVAARLNKPEAS
ncbi:MAG: SDR family oxidoreductase [Polyangiaceae bacterium]|nr:SDR family oxidoreductase [Polyangiaceae bacterium]